MYFFLQWTPFSTNSRGPDEALKEFHVVISRITSLIITSPQ